MFPNFQLGSKIISAYMILSLIGILVSLFYCFHTAEKEKLDQFHVLYGLLLSSIGVAIGGHVLYGFTNFYSMVALFKLLPHFSSFSVFLQKVNEVFGGSVFYGGLLGGLLVGYLYLHHYHLPLDEYFDVVAPGIPLFHFFGRLGCFFSGCCYGVPWQYGVTYHYSLAPYANDVARFPVQLVEAIFNLLLFCLIHFLLKKKKLPHRLLLLYLTIYPIYRFFLEFLRGDSYRGFLLGFSTSQIISVALFFIASMCWILLFIKNTELHVD